MQGEQLKDRGTASIFIHHHINVVPIVDFVVDLGDLGQKLAATLKGPQGH